MPIVKFTREKKEVEVQPGENLRRAAMQAGINLYAKGEGFFAQLNDKVLNCHGFGQCGRCRVNITKGMENASEMGMVESARLKVPLPTPVTPGGLDPLPVLAYVGNEETMRLACCTQVNGDIEVETVPELNLFGENFFS